jgi:NAD(P)-dependent dehydrogenase (short-subunit alcohol dehydrogenase family)
MRIIVVGATGTIGSPLAAALAERHEVVRVGNRSGDFQLDATDPGSVERLFRDAGPFDALVSLVGGARFKPVGELTEEDFEFSFRHKLMGQINLVRAGLPHVRDGGSFTLTSGVLSQEPMPGSSAITLVNRGLEGFAFAAALEMPRGVRINVVSPPWVTETLEELGWDTSIGLPAARVAPAYIECVEGNRNGETLDARDFAGSIRRIAALTPSRPGSPGS